MQNMLWTVWLFFKMLTLELPYDPEIVLVGLYPIEMKTCAYKNLYMNVHSSIIHNVQKVETTQMSIN